jgi:hypothetical protein
MKKIDLPFFKGDLLARYINYVLKMLVSFGIAIIISLIIRAIFHLSPVWLIVMTFLLLLIINPFTSKINFTIGYYIQNKYMEFLEKQTNKIWGKK